MKEHICPICGQRMNPYLMPFGIGGWHTEYICPLCHTKSDDSGSIHYYYSDHTNPIEPAVSDHS